MSTPSLEDPLDGDRGDRLARAVADAADAWLKDPADSAVYGYLVEATLRYRAWARPLLPNVTGGRVRGHQREELTDAVDDEPTRLGDVAPDVVASLRASQAAPD